jgi:polyhydroxyalkanoate synthesis regulator phasin
MTTTQTTENIERQIKNIESAAFGMGHKPNAGQQARIDALKAQLAEAR